MHLHYPHKKSATMFACCRQPPAAIKGLLFHVKKMAGSCRHRKVRGAGEERASEEETMRETGTDASAIEEALGGGEEEEGEWVAEVEEGVLIHFVSLQSGGNLMKRIRFSEELFNVEEAREWLRENSKWLMELYSVQQPNSDGEEHKQALACFPRKEDDLQTGNSSVLAGRRETESAGNVEEIDRWVEDDEDFIAERSKHPSTPIGSIDEDEIERNRSQRDDDGADSESNDHEERAEEGLLTSLHA